MKDEIRLEDFIDGVSRGDLDVGMDFQAWLSSGVQRGDITGRKGVGDLEFTDPRRVFLGLGTGKSGDRVAAHTQRANEMAFNIRKKMSLEIKARWLEAQETGALRGKEDYEAVNDYIIAHTDQMRQAALDGANNPSEVVKSAEALRSLLGELHTIRDSFSRTIEGKGVGFRDYYTPDVEAKAPLFGSPFKPGERGFKQRVADALPRAEQRTRPVDTPPQRPGTTPEVFSRFEMPRTRSGNKLERDIRKLGDLYAEDLAGKVAGTIAVKSGESVAKAFDAEAARIRKEIAKGSRTVERQEGETYREAHQRTGAELKKQVDGMENSAYALREMNQYVWSGKTVGISGAARRRMRSSRGGMIQDQTALAMSRAFNLAKYTINVPFNVLRQWQSLGLISAMPDIDAGVMGRAIANAFTPEVRATYKAYSTGQMKQGSRGSVFREGLGDTPASPDMIMPKGKVRRLADAAVEGLQKPTNKIEDMTGYIATSMGLEIGRKAGLTGKALGEFASDIAGQSQSIYISQGRAPILGVPEMRALVPAQSYTLDAYNSARSIFSDNIGAKHYDTAGEKRAALLRMFTTMSVMQLAHTYKNSHEENKAKLLGEAALTTASSMLPFSDPILPFVQILVGGPGEGKLYTNQLVDDSIVQPLMYAHNGDMGRAFASMAKNILPAGAALARWEGTNRKIEQNILREDERIMGTLFGWWTTESGKEYLRGFDGGGKKPVTMPPTTDITPRRGGRDASPYQRQQRSPYERRGRQ